MADTYNVFISWSGDRSHRAAKALHKFLPDFVPTAKPWLSSSNIDKGARWREATAVALESTTAGIFCLTPENLAAPWVLFEAGAIAKKLDPKTYLWTFLLCGLDHKNIDDPLDAFQHTKPDKGDTRELLHSIQKFLEPDFDQERFNRRFEKTWDDLERELKAVTAMPGPSPAKFENDKAVTEILERLRALAVPIAEIAAESEVARRERLQAQELRTAVAGTSRALAQPITAIIGSAAWEGALAGLGGKPNPWLEVAKAAAHVESMEAKAAQQIPGLKGQGPRHRMAEAFAKAPKSKPDNG